MAERVKVVSLDELRETYQKWEREDVQGVPQAVPDPFANRGALSANKPPRASCPVDV